MNKEKKSVEKEIYTFEQCPWVEYIDIDEKTFERKLLPNTPKKIVKMYTKFLNNIKFDVPDSIETYDIVDCDKGVSYKSKSEREEIIKVKRDFENERNKCTNLIVPSELYLNYLERLENILNKYKFEEDSRFIERNLLDVKWLSNDDAINYLFDNITNNNPICPHEIPKEKNLANIDFDQNQYFNEGNICKQEKKMLLSMIKEIKKFIIRNIDPKN